MPRPSRSVCKIRTLIASAGQLRVALQLSHMFRAAYQKACKFTKPVLQFSVHMDGKCQAGAATFIILNEDGWILTAAHVMMNTLAIRKSNSQSRAWETRRDAINSDTKLSSKERSKQLATLGKPHKKSL